MKIKNFGGFKMFKKNQKGFTLIELLIVVAIIGILAALLIPNAITAMQKAKQKATMKDTVSMATAAADYVTDNGEAPESGALAGAITPNHAWCQALSPFYMKICPASDQWGNAYYIYSGASIGGNFGIVADDVGDDDFLLLSTGRRGALEGFTYDQTNPAAGMFTVSGMVDFDNDLINWSGTWIRAPRVNIAGT